MICGHLSAAFRQSAQRRKSVKPSAQPTLVRTRHLPAPLAGEVAAIKTTLAAATQRHKALQALLSRHITAHPEMPGFRPTEGPSTQKPDQRRCARTTGSGWPQPSRQSSSPAYLTAGTRAGSPRRPRPRAMIGISPVIPRRRERPRCPASRPADWARVLVAAPPPCRAVHISDSSAAHPAARKGRSRSADQHLLAR